MSLNVPSYLQRRKGIIYFRRRIPQPLRIVFGKSEIKKSLRTGNHYEAMRKARHIAEQVDESFKKAWGMVKKKQDDMEGGIGFMEFEDVEIGNFKAKKVVIDGPSPEEERKHLEKLISLQSGIATAENSNDISLSRLIEKYKEEKIKEDSWVPETIKEYGKMYDRFVWIIGGGDIYVRSIGHEQARRYKEILKQLPPNLEKNKKYKGLPVEAVLKIITDNSRKLSVKTINKYLTLASSLFEWAKRHSYVDDNYFANITLRENNRRQKSDNRKGFDATDLEKLFGTKTFTCPPPKYSYQYWIPLIALYSAARIEEIAQLYLDDIYHVEGVWVFDINDNGDKRLKNRNSIRILPIHHKLIDLGLLRHVDSLRAKGKDRLFPELPKKKGEKCSSRVSKWFNERYRRKYGVTGAGKVFHSFRHTVTNHLKQAGFPESKVSSITGHLGKTGIAYDVYSEDYNIHIKKELIESLDFKLPVQLKPYPVVK